MWQAMLASVGIPQTSHILINGFITVDGQKMSKSLGNVIDPVEIVSEYGVDALRYFAIRELSPHEDGDFSRERFVEAYNANLANGIGNLTNRIMKMAEDNIPQDTVSLSDDLPSDYVSNMNEFNLHFASHIIWHHVADLDKRIQETQPFKLIKDDQEAGQREIAGLVEKLHTVALMLRPILPQTADGMLAAIRAHKKPETPLFNRI
jgi:methionyl-tRNA synthetase